MNPARRTRHHSGARPVPGRCGDIGAGAYGVSCASAGAEPLRAGTARAPKSARTPGISPLHRQKSNHPKIAADDWLLVPEGRRRILAGGKPARAGAAPGCHAKRAMPQRGIEETFWGGRAAAFLPPPVASGRPNREHSAGIPDHFFDAPLGHRANCDGFRGRRPLPRTCPRLISSGVPPGRKAGESSQEGETLGAGYAFQSLLVAALPRIVHCISTLQQNRPC